MKKGLRHGYRKVSALAMTLDTGTSEPGDAAVPSFLGYHIDMNLRMVFKTGLPAATEPRYST